MSLPPIVYQVGGKVIVQPIRSFLDQYGRSTDGWSGEDMDRWQEAHSTSAVQAFACPESPHPQLVGVLLYDTRRRHLGILHVLVAPDYRRRGVAARMAWHLTHYPNHRRYPTVSALCPDNQDAAISWLRHCGFKAISVVPDHAEGRDYYLFSWQRKRDHDEATVLSPDPAAGDSSGDSSGPGGQASPGPDPRD